MESANVCFCPLGEGAIDVPALIVRGAARFAWASGTCGRRRAVDGYAIVGGEHVQRQPFAVGATVMVSAGVVVKAVFREASGAAEVRGGKGFGHARRSQHHGGITQ